MPQDYKKLLETLETFKQYYSEEYEIFSPVSNHNLELFESKINRQLPEDFRWFLLNIGNGIVNKSNGNFDLLDPINFDHTKDLTRAFNLKQRTVYHCDKEDDGDEYPFETTYGKSFKPADFKFGTIPLANYGRGSYSFLVVRGSEFNNIWTNHYAANGEIYPEYADDHSKSRLTFSEWLLQKLEGKIDYKEWLEQGVERNEEDRIVAERQKKAREQAKTRFRERRSGYDTYEPELSFHLVMKGVAIIYLLIKGISEFTSC